MKLSIAEQLKLLKKCISGQMDLDEELNRRGLSYDDLRYRSSTFDQGRFPDINHSSSLPLIENCWHKKHQIPTVSFFAGCGGVDVGFSRAGYSNLVAIEKNAQFCCTLKANKSASKIIGPPEYSGDVKNRDEIIESLRSIIGFSKHGFSGVFHGGPPCQSFSIAANQRFAKNDNNFKRVGFSHSDYGTLLFDYIYYIKTFRPVAFLIENVAGLLTVDNGKQLSDALMQLRANGYIITGPTVVNASDYQVPQNRSRVVIIGHRRHGKPFVLPKPYKFKVPCGNVFAKSILNTSNHITRKHKAESVLRYMELAFGERDQLGRVDRLDPRIPSKTVIAGGSKGGGRSHLHPYIPRTLSVRESARLQTFPDSYIFRGTPARQFTQVGNAVPPLLAFHIAVSIYNQIFDKGNPYGYFISERTIGKDGAGSLAQQQNHRIGVCSAIENQ